MEETEPIRLERNQLGKTGLYVTPLCWGCAPLGNMPNAFGYEVTAEQTEKTLEAAFLQSVNFFDTANNYGVSEERLGKALSKVLNTSKNFIIATKADRDPITNEFSAARIRESVLGSIAKLGISPLPLVYLHDPEKHPLYSALPSHVMNDILAPDGPVAELEKMKSEGLIKNIGISGGPVQMLLQFVETGRFDVVITHNRWNLLFRTANQLIEAAHRRGMGIVSAAPFMSGVLTGSSGSNRFAYQTTPPSIEHKVAELTALCTKYDIPLAAAALQFSMHDSRVGSTVVGIASPEQVTENIRLSMIPIPKVFWDEAQLIAIFEGDPEAIANA